MNGLIGKDYGVTTIYILYLTVKEIIMHNLQPM